MLLCLYNNLQLISYSFDSLIGTMNVLRTPRKLSTNDLKKKVYNKNWELNTAKLIKLIQWGKF
jgi:hypothetical protein